MYRLLKQHVPHCVMARLPPNRFTWPWGDADSCPCGSGERYIRCCKRGRNELPYIKMKEFSPKGPKTNYSHPKCYLASTSNCSKQISREHYVSKSILKEFPGLKVGGLLWQRDGESTKIGIESLTVKCLCTRHNSALSTIDDLAYKAFVAFAEAPRYAAYQKHPGRAQHHLISGEALELWMVKLLCAVHFGGVSSFQGAASRENFCIDSENISRILCDGTFPRGAGLYVTQSAGDMPKKGIVFAPLTDTQRRETVGVRVNFGTLCFETMIKEPPGRFFEKMMQQKRFRTDVIDFCGAARDSRVCVSWPNKGRELSRLGFEIAPEARSLEKGTS